MQASGDPWKRVAEPVRAVLERLAAAGFEAALVGGCVRDLVAGRAPHDFDVATDAGPGELVAIFPRAVPIGLRHGTVMVPTRSGPVDVTRYRAPGLEGDLAHRDFTCNAMALPLGSAEVVDPHDGRRDLEAGVLRAVGDPAARLAEDPLRALRAARFLACADMRPDPALCDALRNVSLAGVAAERKRAELDRMLRGARADAAVALLRETGLEAQLVPRARPDCATLMAALPPRRSLRLAAWLRGTDAAALLARLRVPHVRSRAILRLLALHPIDTHASATPASLRRILQRVGDAGLADLLALRRAECAAGSAPDGVAERLAALQRVREALAREGRLALVRGDLALDGAGVMQALDCPAGPRVGRALRYLTECVLDDPGCNTEAGLRAKLAAWSDPGERHP